MNNDRKIRFDSIRGWVAILLVTIGGVGASLHSYYAGQAKVFVMRDRIKAMEKNIAGLQETTTALLQQVTRLKTLHETQHHRR